MSIDSWKAANMAATVFFSALAPAMLSEDKKQQLLETIASPVAPEASALFVEFVYANREAFPPEMLLAAVEVCKFVTAIPVYGFDKDMRGSKIAQILLGKTVKDAPEPLAQFVVAAEALPPTS